MHSLNWVEIVTVLVTETVLELTSGRLVDNPEVTPAEPREMRRAPSNTSSLGQKSFAGDLVTSRIELEKSSVSHGTKCEGTALNVVLRTDVDRVHVRGAAFIGQRSDQVKKMSN
jgi:hypothetical protein